MQINVHKNANAGYYPAKMNEAFLSRIKFQEMDKGGIVKKIRGAGCVSDN
jgi:hypothetical protein